MFRRCVIFTALIVIAMNGMARGEGLKMLDRIYLSCHASPWISEPADDPDHKSWETWPGRTAQIRPQDYEIRRRFYELMKNAGPDDGLFIVPSYPSASRPATEVELIDLGKKYFGDRCVVTSEVLPPRDQIGGDEFSAAVERDEVVAARAAKSQGVEDEAFRHEFEAWVRAKAWITHLTLQLKANGYTFDPKTVEFVCWGSDFRGCAATYPIMMGRALNLSNPIERRWDLIVHDEGKMVVDAMLVMQNVKLDDGRVRLYIARNAQGRYYADFWEGIHGPMDRARQIQLIFPPDSVRLVNWHGEPTSAATYGNLTVGIGCGGHTPHREQIIEATEKLSLDEFYAALVAGKIVEKP